MVTIRTREGLCIQEKGLDYQELKTLVEKLEGLCNAYYLHEKSFIKGYKFMKIERKDDVTVYKIEWKDLVTILETPIITSIRI